MSAATVSAAGNLATALAGIRDPWHQKLDLISHVETLAEAVDGDYANLLTDCASEIRAQLFQDAQTVLDRNDDEREADRYGGFVDTLRLWDECERKRHEALVRNRLIKPSQYQPIESTVLRVAI